MEQIINDYILEVEENLSSLPLGDRNDVLEFYREFLLDGDFQNRAAIEKELGTPQQLARKIVADYVINDQPETEATDRAEDTASSSQSLHTIWRIFVGICAIPTGIIIGITLTAIFLGLFCAFLGILVGFIGLALGLLVAGVVGIVIGLNLLVASSWAPGFFYLGAGLIVLSICLFIVPAIIQTLRFLAAKCAQFARFLGRKIFKKRYYKTKTDKEAK
ncbi:DUF1700 domain-containing protein [Lactobacillus sp. ESL0731]|uniref:DUF1700 domain-containing protein n=1 Tax=unclassified Lactobacillus TaxID=2620435 RepID=UPI0023F8F77F|nr:MULTISPECIES: DUF1700 domain-containing protein [unclassified Lactobacillus]WEV50803.1 DUF1700 domain-containing protein [Lactobacillus sp. ESL0700]WEV61934.1 DUF1700 domain-containing protein [Lactobacillus sp. ESL0731]